MNRVHSIHRNPDGIFPEPVLFHFPSFRLYKCKNRAEWPEMTVISLITMTYGKFRVKDSVEFEVKMPIYVFLLTILVTLPVTW